MTSQPPDSRSTRWRDVCAGVVVWAVIQVATAAAGAQTVTATTGAVNGLVTDSTRAAVPGVTVSLAGASLMATRTVTSDERGAYRFSAVPPGEYSVTFTLAGFGTIVREGIHVGLGFAATVDTELQPGGVTDSASVRGAPVIDRSSTEVTTRFDSETVAALPGARDIFAVLASTPGVAMARMDVGGNGALAMQEYTAYGLRAITGMHRNEVEGIRVGGANGANDNFFSDFASFSEIAIKAVAHSATMPVPGTMAQYVSKSGGNAYRGSAYAELQSEAWQATNIDVAQLARGVTGGPGLDARDVNRLAHFRDAGADVGGYLKKDRAWWYASYRDTELEQRYPWLLDAPATLTATVTTGKLTYQLSPRHTLVGYLQREKFEQSSYFVVGTSQPIQTSDALPGIVFPVSVWKTEYHAAPTDAIYLEARVGAYLSDAVQTFKSTAPRIADTAANTVRGGSFSAERRITRPQVNASLSFIKSGWGGSHTFRVGGEYMSDQVDAPHSGYGNACNCISTLNNGAPTQVQLLLGTNVSSNDLVTTAGFVDDAWRIGRRLTLSLGIRLDRYQPVLPVQVGPAGQIFAAVDPALTFDNWGPRAGASVDLTGDGRTVLKLHYGKFWLYPGANFTAAFNPNPSGWSRTHVWTNDANVNGHWDPGEEGPMTSVAGGSASTRLDGDVVNTHVQQGSAYVEREVAADFAVRSGVVVNARRAPFGTVNVNRPLSAYTAPVSIVDPGPDGRIGSADDGPTVTAYNLAPDSLGVAPLNVTTNLPASDSEYYTWEITATRRQRGRWSLLASFTETWNREAALGTGNDFTPNALVHTVNGQSRFTTWQAKLHATLDLPHDVRLIPLVRSQSGVPFARTFVRTLNYGNATIKAEPVGAHRTPTVALVDLRAEKGFRIGRARVRGSIDVYNLFNTNAEQAVTTSSGAAWLRPTIITGPRILRLGGRLDW
jgi:hypothetical protein